MMRRFVMIALALASSAGAQQPTRPDSIDPRARVVPHDRSVFGPDPNYGTPVYDYQAQLDIYGAKHLNRTQRPLLELGRDLYSYGTFDRAPTPLGAHNILIPQLLVFGDLRSAAGQNTLGSVDAGRWANRLNLDLDLKLTATERVHALFRPLEDNGKFTGMDFTGDSTSFKARSNGEPAALFFEGDLGAILGGLSGRDAPFDMPIAAGLMPLLFHNGIWIEDAFTGGAFTIPAKNSRGLGWSNFDITFFYGGDKLSNPFVGDGKDHGQIGGVNMFVDAYNGYVEAGYAYILGADKGGRDYNSVALSFTRRYAGLVSNSIRYIGAFGGAGGTPGKAGDANGHLVILENSLISSHPLSVVPYLNLFAGFDTPISAARDKGAGGILKNVGLNFEGDAITGFPSLDPSGRDAVGGALGLELLGSSLSHQLVLEVATVYPTTPSPNLLGTQYAGGVRIQQPLTNGLILRLDGMIGKRGGLAPGLDDIRGVRVELRQKF